MTPTSIAQGMHFEHLNGSGYINLSEPEASLLLDVAAIGPSYLPGHGHADRFPLKCRYTAPGVRK